MAATIIVTGKTKLEEETKTRALSFMANNLTPKEIERLEQMARSVKARDMLNNKWALLKMYI